jgi:hypothetical protein
MDSLSISDVKQALDYNFNTGLFTWKYRSDMDARFNNRWIHRPAFTTQTPNGLYKGKIFGYDILAHRAAWAIFHGEWRNDIFHYNNNKRDNRIINLRAHGLMHSSQGYPPYFVELLKSQGHAEALRLK